MLSKVEVIMKPLAPSTPVNVAITGISTSATMLTASDQVRASRITTPPISTTGTEQASAQPTISQKSALPILTVRLPARRRPTCSRGPTPSAPDGVRPVWSAAA